MSPVSLHFIIFYSLDKRYLFRQPVMRYDRYTISSLVETRYCKTFLIWIPRLFSLFVLCRDFLFIGYFCQFNILFPNIPES